MNRKHYIALLLAVSPMLGQAQHHADPNANSLQQEEARRLLDEGHYYAASLLMKNSPEEGEKLICDYYLNESGTDEKIEQFLKDHRLNPYADRLRLIRANILVRQKKYREALSLYHEQSAMNVPEEESVEARLYEAIAYINTGDIDVAEQILRGLEGKKSHEVDVLYYTGYVKYAKGRYAEALSNFEAVENTYDYKRVAPVYMADCYEQLGQSQDALRKIRAYNQQYGSTELYREAARIEGEALYDTGDYYNAIIKLKEYADEEQSPKRTALYKLGMSYFQTKAYGQAAPALCTSAGSERDAMSQNAWLHAGISYINLQNKAQARMAFQQASEMDFDTKVQEEALYNYALLLHDGSTMGFGESVSTFENFLNKFPNSQYKNQVSQHLTEVYFTSKNYPAALASINKIKNPSPEIVLAKQKVLYNLGVQRFTDGDFQSAQDFMLQSIRTKDNAEAYYWKGESEYRLADYSLADTDLKHYLSMQSSNAKNQALARYTLGYTSFKQQKYKEAQPYFEQFVGISETALASLNNEKQLRADAFNRIGDCQFSQRNYDAAYNSYQKALETDRTNGDYSLLQQALISGLRGNYAQKVELLGQLGNQYNESEYGSDALFEQGRAYVQTGEKQKAMDCFTSLIQKYPQSANARKAGNEIGMIYYENQQADDAINAYKKVIQDYPNTEEAQTALSNLKDIYTDQGRVNDYAALAQQTGKTLSAEELDQMTEEAALKATTNGNHDQALTYYQQLEAQTQNADVRQRALTGELHSAANAKNKEAVMDVANKMLQEGSKVSPDVQAEARLLRAQTYMSQGNSDAAVADYQLLAEDTRTVYGAQGTVELAQYAYDTQQYEGAETILSKFIDSGTTHSYWLARAFILLSDVYVATDRSIEANQYLLSLKSNYTESEEINRMIEERLGKMKNEE